jgi:hypothetical protein
MAWWQAISGNRPSSRPKKITFAEMREMGVRGSPYHLLRLHRTLTVPSLSSMAPYPFVA